MIRPKLFLPLMVALLLSSCSIFRPQEQPFTFTVLQLNDVYEISALEGGNAGGLARVGTIRQQLAAENPNTIALLAGDFLSPSLIATLKMDNGERIAGLQMVETLNALGLDYATFGNHEFDNNDVALVQKRFLQSTFQYVAANVQRRFPDGSLARFKQMKQGQESAIPDYAIHEFTDARGRKLRVAIVGVMLPFNQKDYLQYQPVEQRFREAVAAAKQESDVVIGLTHLDMVDDEALAAAVPGVALIVGGHDHDHMISRVGNTTVSKADANAKTVYVHRLTYDPATKNVTVKSTLQKVDNTIPDDPKTKAVVDRWVTQVNNTLEKNGYRPSEIIGKVSTPLECKEVDIRSRQTNFGELTTKAMMAAWPGADLYVLNSGSMRLDDNIVGQITQYDILRTYPFGGGVSEVSLPGTAVTKLLNIGLVTNRTKGGYLQALGVKGETDHWHIHNKPIDPNATYSVVMTDFLASGQEGNLDFLSQYTAVSKKDMQFNGQPLRNDIRDIVIAYLRNEK
ncbi:MAG: bifunctional metallophosphatase/5'-nucleotidase [Lewinellaceae bacterium]|nr:bifunctional metallophosphatase/5'-nucleotidase [Lewinellaceae bacterium]